jgi:hypothetical protein
VEGEDHVHCVGEQLGEHRVTHAVRMVTPPDQRHQVDDVHDANPELRQLLCRR